MTAENTAGESRIRCRVDPESCSWEYRSAIRPAVWAAWRIHYADHQRGAEKRDRFRAANLGNADQPERNTR